MGGNGRWRFGGNSISVSISVKVVVLLKKPAHPCLSLRAGVSEKEKANSSPQVETNNCNNKWRKETDGLLKSVHISELLLIDCITQIHNAIPSLHRTYKRKHHSLNAKSTHSLPMK